MTIATMTPQQLEEKRKQGECPELIDVRTPLEFQELHVEFARNVPLDTLDPAKLVSEQGAVRNHTLYVICRSGSRASVACERLAAAGFAQVVSIEGGTLACEKAGLPMVRGKKAMSLERQVRICAGFLTLVGALLGFVNPWFLLIPAGVGAGLMYAGITDSCAMGILLAKMPWNKRGAS